MRLMQTQENITSYNCTQIRNWNCRVAKPLSQLLWIYCYRLNDYIHLHSALPSPWCKGLSPSHGRDSFPRSFTSGILSCASGGYSDTRLLTQLVPVIIFNKLTMLSGAWRTSCSLQSVLYGSKVHLVRFSIPHSASSLHQLILFYSIFWHRNRPPGSWNSSTCFNSIKLKLRQHFRSFMLPYLV